MFQEMENEDYAGANENIPTARPLSFPPCEVADCVRMTVRVYNPAVNDSRTVQNVLVRARLPTRAPAKIEEKNDDDDDDMSTQSGYSSSVSDSDCSLVVDGAGNHVDNLGTRAYWLQRTLCQCIYGRVRMAYILKRRERQVTVTGEETNGEPFAEWEVTNERCAVKEMSWDDIQQRRIAEDPVSEIYAMAYMANSIIPNIQNVETRQLREIMNQRHVLLPLDLPMSDGRNLYSIMPYCNGGELFAVLDEMTRFTEAQARYWMNQILTGIETLQYMGVCHRDISLENILVHNTSCVIMDFGMSCRVPYTNIPPNSPNFFTPETRGHRQMIEPSGTMGKWNYMSPEIAANEEPFDSHAVDLYAVGAILFTMVTGFHGWEMPVRTDERFRYLSGGFLEQMLIEWNTGLTHACMDLLQRLIFFSPTDRLSLSQIRAHPWMQEEMEPPAARPPWA